MTRFLAVLSGLLLVASVTLMQPWAGLPALVLVALGWWLRPGAVCAVLLAVGVLAVADAGVLASAAAGLVATTYLLNAATVTAPHGVVPTTIPSVAGAVGFAAVAVGAALIPLRLAWAPLAAPVLVVVLYAVVVQGLAVRRARGGGDPRASDPSQRPDVTVRPGGSQPTDGARPSSEPSPSGEPHPSGEPRLTGEARRSGQSWLTGGV